MQSTQKEGHTYSLIFGDLSGGSSFHKEQLYLGVLKYMNLVCLENGFFTYCISHFHTRALPLMWRKGPIATDGREGEAEPFRLSQDLQLNLRPQLLQGKKHEMNGMVTLPHAATAPCVTGTVIYPDLHRSTLLLWHFVHRALYCKKNGEQEK